MDQSLRQRGWSIHSSDDHDSRSQQRPRADSQMTCDTDPMSDAEKLHLLNSAFKDVGDSVDAGEVAVRNNSNGVNRTMSSSVDEEGGDLLAMLEEGGEGGNSNGYEEKSSTSDKDKELEPPKKRRKTGEDEAIALDDVSGGNSSGRGSSSSEDESDNDEKLRTQKRPHIQLTSKQQEQLDLAKNNLSKWAARLFDPNRPRGLVEAPKVIPLNDEFLTAFGKREKEYDEAFGRVVDIDKTSLDIIDVSDDDDEGDKKTTSKDAKKNFSEMTNCKVKISNLSYKTTSASIANTCGGIGPVVDVNLILDDNGQSSGRAYVVFEDHETAILCAEKMNEKSLEGRTLYVSLASASGRKSVNSAKKKQDSRYWDRDISMKCITCGVVGHLSRNCPNEEKLKPCGLCAQVGHDMRVCPQRSVCFNCGVPGHVSRECNQRRGLPERIVCTICYQSGHHRFKCRERPWNAPWQDALCMQCGQRGHLMCSEMRWFFGLKGETCFNCGEKDHIGIDCRRPNVDGCLKNPDIAQAEIERAGETISICDQVSNQRMNRQSRAQNSGNNRPRSMPPPRNRGNTDDYSRRGSSSRDSRWQEPYPQRSHHRF